jgi:N-acyl-D-amino-acid deacylase
VGRWLLYGGTVLDGLGGESAADVVLEGGRIAAILPRGDGVDPAAFAGRVLDCRGLFVAPGFVDAHTHDDTAVFDPTWYVAKIRQGRRGLPTSGTGGR